jgi:hypothetical protein
MNPTDDPERIGEDVPDLTRTDTTFRRCLTILQRSIHSLRLDWTLEAVPNEHGEEALIGQQYEHKGYASGAEVELEPMEPAIINSLDRSTMPLCQEPPKRSGVMQKVILSGRRCTPCASGALLSCLPGTRWAMVFVCTITVQSILNIVLQVLIAQAFLSYGGRHAIVAGSTRVVGLWTVHQIQPQVVIVSFESICQILLAFDAVRWKNCVQAAAVCLNNVGMLLCISLGWQAVSAPKIEPEPGLNVMATWEPEDTPTLDQTYGLLYLGLLINVAIGTIVASIAVWRLAREFAW